MPKGVYKRGNSLRTLGQIAQLKAVQARNQGRMTARREAREQGKKYYEGRPCKFGHTQRLVSTAHCVACHEVYMATWGERLDPDYTRRRRWARNYRAKHPDRIRKHANSQPEYAKLYLEWWRKTHDPDRSRRRAWEKTYREKNALKIAQRRAAKKSTEQIANRKAVEVNTYNAIMGTLA